MSPDEDRQSHPGLDFPDAQLGPGCERGDKKNGGLGTKNGTAGRPPPKDDDHDDPGSGGSTSGRGSGSGLKNDTKSNGRTDHYLKMMTEANKEVPKKVEIGQECLVCLTGASTTNTSTVTEVRKQSLPHFLQASSDLFASSSVQSPSPGSPVQTSQPQSITSHLLDTNQATVIIKLSQTGHNMESSTNEILNPIYQANSPFHLQPSIQARSTQNSSLPPTPHSDLITQQEPVDINLQRHGLEPHYEEIVYENLPEENQSNLTEQVYVDFDPATPSSSPQNNS